MTDRCQGCRAQVMWVVTTYGRELAVNARATSTGNLIFVADGVVAVIDPEQVPGSTRFRAHFCPSGLWRGVQREMAAL